VARRIRPGLAMDSHGSRGNDFSKRRETTWVSLEGYGYFAPGRVAMDEQRQRVMAEGAQRRRLATSEPASKRPSPWQRARQRLGDLVMVFGGTLRQRCASTAVIAERHETGAR
jgi:hypothetical protein